ncbi:MAG TPA: hypothetical protein VNT56_06920 [Acidimicrobiales bacterium]|nr:hypothetical protein [Acidimicrobiales bacterium]
MRSLGEDLVFVSDLHLGDGRAELFQRDASFCRFLGALGTRADERGRRCRLVVLGDFLDFLHVDGSGSDAERIAVGKLERMVAAHGAVFDALRWFCTNGGALDVVVGNHDADLARPAVQSALAAALGGTAKTAPGIHRWQWHRPGEVYAEHGHQYHDINAFSTVLAPWGRGTPPALEETLGAGLGHCLASRRRHSRLVLPAVLAGRAARLVDPRRHARRRAYRREILPGHGATVGLDLATLEHLDALSARTVAALPLRLGRHVLRTRAGRRPPPDRDYLAGAAAQIARILAESRSPVGLVVMGHSHRAGQWALGGGSAPVRYLNTGAWSSVRGGGDGLPTFVDVPGGVGTAARLRGWSDASDETGFVAVAADRRGA